MNLRIWRSLCNQQKAVFRFYKSLTEYDHHDDIHKFETDAECFVDSKGDRWMEKMTITWGYVRFSSVKMNRNTTFRMTKIQNHLGQKNYGFYF